VGRPPAQLLSTEPDFMTRSYSFLGYVRSQSNVFISAGIGDFFLGLPKAIQAEFKAEYAWTIATQPAIVTMHPSSRLSAGAAGAAAAAPASLGRHPSSWQSAGRPGAATRGPAQPCGSDLGLEALGIYGCRLTISGTL
jgi:hypothetical protein